MSKLNFQAAITLNNATPDSEGHYRCQISMSDRENNSRPNDITVGDITFFDTSTYEAGTYTLFRINEVFGVNRYGEVDITLEYLEVNENPSGAPMLEFLIGQVGVIARPSQHLGLLPLVSPTTQLVKDNFSFYLLNYNLMKVLDAPRQDDLGQSNVTLHTAQWLPVDSTTGRVELPNVPIGDFVLNMGMAFLMDGSTVELSDLVPQFDTATQTWYTQISTGDLEALEYMVGALTLTYLIEKPLES